MQLPVNQGECSWATANLLPYLCKPLYMQRRFKKEGVQYWEARVASESSLPDSLTPMTFLGQHRHAKFFRHPLKVSHIGQFTSSRSQLLLLSLLSSFEVDCQEYRRSVYIWCVSQLLIHSAWAQILSQILCKIARYTPWRICSLTVYYADDSWTASRALLQSRIHFLPAKSPGTTSSCWVWGHFGTSRRERHSFARRGMCVGSQEEIWRHGDMLDGSPEAELPDNFRKGVWAGRLSKFQGRL